MNSTKDRVHFYYLKRNYYSFCVQFDIYQAYDGEKSTENTNKGINKQINDISKFVVTI